MICDVDPYWINAATWWTENRNNDVEAFNKWLAKQGVLIIDRDEFTPYIQFDNDLSATLFKMKWANKWVKKIHAVAAQAIASSTIKVSAGADNDGTERKCVYQTLILKKPMNEQQALELAKELEEADFINPTDVCARAAAAIRSLVADYPPTPISDHQAEMNDAKKKMYRLKNEIEDALRVLGIQW